MNLATTSRAPRIGAACLLAVLALLLVRAPWASPGDSGDAPQATSPPEAAVCGGSGRSAVQAMDMAVAEAMERTRREQAEAEANPSSWVVLNNRGYNYGPPHPVRIDAELFEQERAGATPR